MDRREFLKRVLGGAAVLPLVAPAQPQMTTVDVVYSHGWNDNPNRGLQMVPLESIKIDWSKWQLAEHPGEQEMFGRLVESIKAHGVLNPIMIKPTHDLIDGTYRVEAARAVGLTEIPAIVRDDLTLMNNIHFNANVRGTPFRQPKEDR